jgi:hypothetical protein
LSCMGINVLELYPSVLAVSWRHKFCPDAACCRIRTLNLEVPHDQLKYEECGRGSHNCCTTVAFSGTRQYASVQSCRRWVGVVGLAGIVGFVETWDVEPAASVLL